MKLKNDPWARADEGGVSPGAKLPRYIATVPWTSVQLAPLTVTSATWLSALNTTEFGVTVLGSGAVADTGEANTTPTPRNPATAPTPSPRRV